MKRVAELIVEWLFFFNKIAIIILCGFGIDHISNKYDIPWQIVFLFVFALLMAEIAKKERQKKNANQNKSNKLCEYLSKPDFDCLSTEQKIKIVDIIQEKEYRGVMR